MGFQAHAKPPKPPKPKDPKPPKEPATTVGGFSALVFIRRGTGNKNLQNKEQQGMVKEEFAAWERSHGFASDRFLRDEASRVGEFEIKREPVPVVPVFTTPRNPELFYA